MSENMKIWNAVSKTNPANTKRVNQRGGFTAIGAHSQIMAATEQFGAIGVGWGYDVVKVERFDQFIVVYVEIWHGDRENRFGPVLGCAEMFGNRPDHDAPKKATTDAITKGLSQIGFNADVFLGLFDDNKYVADREQEETEKATPPLDAPASRDRLVAGIVKQPTKQAVDKLWARGDFQGIFDQLPEPMQNEVKKAKSDCEDKFPDEPPAEVGQ